MYLGHGGLPDYHQYNRRNNAKESLKGVADLPAVYWIPAFAEMSAQIPDCVSQVA
jgi:hypothetical protein